MESTLRKFHFFPLFAIAISLFYYVHFLDNFFTHDDFRYLENMHLGWVDVLLGYGSLRIVSNLSWWPLFIVSGTNPFAYNLFALIIFTSNAILLYFLLVRLLHDRVMAFLAAAFFITSSVGVDALFWKSTNSSLICLFFYLSTLICYADYRQTGRRKLYIWAMVLYVFAMFSKEEAASLPFIAALIDIVCFRGWQDKRGLFRRIIPFCTVVAFYIVANVVVFNILLGKQAASQTMFLLRPLYSLFGSGTAFFLAPAGFVSVKSPLVFLTVLFIVLSFLLKRNRNLLLLGYLWAFFAFLPQSLSMQGQLEPVIIINSISRYLYSTSIGVSIVFAVVLTGVREWIPARIWYGLAGSVLLLFIWIHYPRIKDRGEEWQYQGVLVEGFITELKQVMPAFPSPCYVYMREAPAGRSFLAPALRVFYGNTQIRWLRDSATAQKDVPIFFVNYMLSPDVHVQVIRER